MVMSLSDLKQCFLKLFSSDYLDLTTSTHLPLEKNVKYILILYLLIFLQNCFSMSFLYNFFES